MAIELIKLTTEEDNKLTLFVGKAVRKNLSFPVLDTRVGNGARLTVQDMFNASTDTLQKIGKSLKKMQADFDPEFSSTESQKVGTVEISDLIEIVKLIIKENKYKEASNSLRRKRAELANSIASMKTPQELRIDAEKELASLPSDAELAEA